jgi:3-methyladenine DNA glycosylase/8-oxoguanine DNA glycosylase
VSGGPDEPPAATRRIRPALRVDLDVTLGVLVRGRDPTTRADPDGTWWRALRTPEGPATLALGADGDTIVARAWGPGAAWALEAAPDLVGAGDSLAGFAPEGLVRDLHRRWPGLRIIRARPLFPCLLVAILEQRVAGKLAWMGYHALLRHLGAPAPGPRPLLLPPAPEAVAAMPYYDFHPLRIERRRAVILARAAGMARRLERASILDPVKGRKLLEAVPGIGPWTSAEVARVALGDADAVSVGDFGLPALVAWNLAGEREADDRRMLELLEPYRGHRGRVQRLLELGGAPVPRRGPRAAITPFWRH